MRVKCSSYSLIVAILCSMAVCTVCRGDAAAVLAGKTEHDKAAVLIKARRTGITATDLVRIAQREKMESVASLALGLYLEGAKVDAKEAAAIASVFAKRRSMYGMTAAMVAINKPMAQIVDVLINDKKAGGTSNHQLAAAILLMYARSGDLGVVRYEPKEEEFVANAGPDSDPKPKKKKGKGKGKGRNAAFTKANRAALVKSLQTLLDSKDALTLERSVAAAAYMRIKECKAKVDALADHQSIEIQATRLLFAAFTEQPLPAESLTRVFAATRRADSRFSKLTPAMSNYDVDTTALAYACQAIGEAKATEQLSHLHKALKNRDLRVQIDAAQALAKISDAASVEYLIPLIKSSDWPVLISVCDALGTIGSKEAIEPLIAKLQNEKGRFRLDITYALSSIAGETQSKTPEGWDHWWKGAKTTFEPDAEKTKAFRAKYRVQDMNIPHLGFFYHLPIYSNRLAFVLDTSASMKGEKIASLKENLHSTLEALKRKVYFNIVDFGGHVQVMFPRKLVSAAAASSAAIQHVGYMELTLGTRTYDGMEAGLWLPGVDTIIYLSDGAPVASKINSWQRIMRAIHLVNRYRPVAVFCVEFNAGGSNASAMKEIAARNFGLAGSPNDGEN